MDPVSTCDLLLSYLKQSNLNFYLVESPFSASIEIRKSFIKDLSGITRTSASGLSHSTFSHPEERKLLEAEKEALIKENETIQFQLLTSQTELANVKADFEQLRIIQKSLKEKKDDLEEVLKEKTSEIELVKKSVKNHEAINTVTKSELNQVLNTVEVNKKEIEELQARAEEVVNKNSNLREQLVTKDDELGKAFEERVKLEEKLNSLLDVLYGCPECGLNKCECVKEDECSEQYHSNLSPPPTPAAVHPPPRSSHTSQWTPPPTPPCTSCGGENIGPSPSSICFGCISPLKIKAPPDNNSPSRTQPGTPPSLSRLENLSSKNRA